MATRKEFRGWSNRGFLQVPRASNMFKPVLNGQVLNCEIVDFELNDADNLSSFGLLTYNGRTITQIVVRSNDSVEIDSEIRVAVDAFDRTPIEGSFTLEAEDEETYFALNRCKGKPVSFWCGYVQEDCWLVQAASSSNTVPRIWWRTSRVPAWGSQADHTDYPPLAFFDSDIADLLTVQTSGTPAANDDIVVPTAFDAVAGYGVTTQEPGLLPADTKSIHLRYPALLYIRIKEVQRELNEDGFEYSVEFEEVLVT